VYGENNQSTTILLMHDAMGNRQQLVYTAEFLAEHGYRVVSFDFPGLGSKPNERLTMATAVAATKEVVERQCGGEAVLVGFGMGGYVAMVFASQNLDMVKGMILCNTSFDLSGFSGSIISNMMGAVYKITPRKSLWSLVLQQHPTANREKVTRCYLKNVVDYDRWSTCAALLSEPHQGFFREALRSFKGKVIMIIGDDDCKYAEDKFASVMYDGRLAVIKGGHELMAIDDVTSTEFHEILDGFLETLNIKSTSSSSTAASSSSVAAAAAATPAASSSNAGTASGSSSRPASAKVSSAKISSAKVSSAKASSPSSKLTGAKK
jgi:pimeloyl-ACP methyl ester carboxylesterase